MKIVKKDVGGMLGISVSILQDEVYVMYDAEMYQVLTEMDRYLHVWPRPERWNLKKR